MLSVHSYHEEKKEHSWKKGMYVKYFAKLVKIVQSAVAILDKTSKGKCIPYFFFPGEDISSCLTVYQDVPNTPFHSHVTPLPWNYIYQATFCIFHFEHFVWITLALNEERSICSLWEVPSGLSLVRRRRRRSGLQCEGAEGARSTGLGEGWSCKATLRSPSASPQPRLTPGRGTWRALHPQNRQPGSGRQLGIFTLRCPFGNAAAKDFRTPECLLKASIDSHAWLLRCCQSKARARHYRNQGAEEWGSYGKGLCLSESNTDPWDTSESCLSAE